MVLCRMQEQKRKKKIVLFFSSFIHALNIFRMHFSVNKLSVWYEYNSSLFLVLLCTLIKSSLQLAKSQDTTKKKERWIEIMIYNKFIQCTLVAFMLFSCSVRIKFYFLCLLCPRSISPWSHQPMFYDIFSLMWGSGTRVLWKRFMLLASATSNGPCVVWHFRSR